MNVNFYHYLEGVADELKNSLTAKLEEVSTEIKEDANLSNLNDAKVAAIVHASKKDDVTNQVNGCDLVIYFSQGGGRPTDKDNEKRLVGKKKWICGTETLINYFDKLKEHLEAGHSSDDWRYDAWVPKWPEHLVAAYLLQLVKKSDEYAGVKNIPLPDNFWASALNEFKEQQKQFSDISSLDQLSFDQGCEEVSQLLSKIAEPKAQ